MTVARSALALAASLLASAHAFAQDSKPASDDAADLAKKLQNPVAALISVPLQSNLDFGGGPNGDGSQYKLNIQPVIPVGLGKDWNVISRSILPILYQNKLIDTGGQGGLGDLTQSFFFSPKEPTGGWIWGVGPVFLIPTATDDLLGLRKWGAGPTAVLLRQEHGWTYGILANHIWSFAGDSARQNVSATFLQPFAGYTTGAQTTFTLNSETTYDWENSQWTIPLNLMVAQLVKLQDLPLQFQAGARYYAAKPSTGPDWGLRLNVVFLFPA